jgi:hypothetical protein
MSQSYAKLLTKNDAGETGGHQGGICVPRANAELIDFFPRLKPDQYNPESWITCIDELDVKWEMRYVYYNGRILTPPQSTRNEYRITYMTKFFRQWNAESGDSVVFTSTHRPDVFNIRVDKAQPGIVKEDAETYSESQPRVIKLRGWSRVY